MKQFCFAKGIYGVSIDWMFDNPYAGKIPTQDMPIDYSELENIKEEIRQCVKEYPSRKRKEREKTEGDVQG